MGSMVLLSLLLDRLSIEINRVDAILLLSMLLLIACGFGVYCARRADDAAECLLFPRFLLYSVSFVSGILGVALFLSALIKG